MSLADAVVRAVADRTPFADPAVESAVVGENMVLVEVRDRDPAGPPAAAGVAHRPPGSAPTPPVATGTDALAVGEWVREPPLAGGTDPADRPGETDPADHVRGTDPAGRPGETDHPDRSRATDPPDDRVARALGLATLNALSAPAVDWRPGDPFERLSDAGTVATVGLFRPALRKFGATTVRVIERGPVDPPAPPGVTVETYVADGPDQVPGDVEGILRGVDVLFVTGSALIYGGTDRYLAAADPRSTVVLVGATASFVPDPAFEAGVDVLAGARVTDPAAVARAARDGACATDLHGEGVEKVFVTADDARADRPG